MRVFVPESIQEQLCIDIACFGWFYMEDVITRHCGRVIESDVSQAYSLEMSWSRKSKLIGLRELTATPENIEYRVKE